jgi:hypothetical protein
MVWSVTASSSAVKLSRSISSCIRELNASTVRAALMPPAVRTVWASSRRRLPRTTTSLPAWWAAMAARSPAAPVPITRTLATLLRS